MVEKTMELARTAETSQEGWELGSLLHHFIPDVAPRGLTSEGLAKLLRRTTFLEVANVQGLTCQERNARMESSIPGWSKSKQDKAPTTQAPQKKRGRQDDDA